MPLLVGGRRVRLPQSAGDLARAHPLLEVSRARAGGFEADPSPPHPAATTRSPPKQTLNLAQLRCRRRVRGPAAGSRLPACAGGICGALPLYPRGHLLSPPLPPQRRRGGPERLGDWPVSHSSGWKTPRDAPFAGRAAPTPADAAPGAELGSRLARAGPRPVDAARCWAPGGSRSSGVGGGLRAAPPRLPPSPGLRAPVIFSLKSGPSFSTAGRSRRPRPDGRVLFCFPAFVLK